MSNSIAQSLIADLKQEGAFSRSVLEAVPADKFDWRPHEKSMPLGTLASHIAETPTWLGSMMDDVFDFGAAMADYKPFAAADPAELVAALDDNLAGAVALLEDKDDDFMAGIWKARRHDALDPGTPRGAPSGAADRVSADARRAGAAHLRADGRLPQRRLVLTYPDSLPSSEASQASRTISQSATSSGMFSPALAR
jgi:hypothetical protein